MTYGEQLKRLRLGMQPPMTQQHLAELLGVHVTTSRCRPSARSGRLLEPCASPPTSCFPQRRWVGRAEDRPGLAPIPALQTVNGRQDQDGPGARPCQVAAACAGR